MTEGFSEGQAVYVQIDAEQVEGVFERPGEPGEAVTVESPAADGPYKRDVGWVRHSDTGEVQTFLYERISRR